MTLKTNVVTGSGLRLTQIAPACQAGKVGCHETEGEFPGYHRQLRSGARRVLEYGDIPLPRFLSVL